MLRSQLVALAACVLGFASAARAETAAADFIEFETVLDGKCHILSEGGKLTLMRNTHPAKPILYRLERLFVGRPQGLMDGVIPPGADAQKLGCDRVGGRPQRWRVKRARFVEH
ncbi:MAG: hypothetical protein AB7O21_12480 [Gammaproteobacteria bacterium]